MLLMYSMYFVVVALSFQLLAKIVQLLYHVSDLLTSICKHVNNCVQFNTTAKTNHIDSARPAPLSMYELANSLLNIGILIGLGISL